MQKLTIRFIIRKQSHEDLLLKSLTTFDLCYIEPGDMGEILIYIHNQNRTVY